MPEQHQFRPGDGWGDGKTLTNQGVSALAGKENWRLGICPDINFQRGVIGGTGVLVCIVPHTWNLTSQPPSRLQRV